MSFIRKPTVIKFNGESDKQRFENWAFSKSKTTAGINKAKNAMRLAQRNTEQATKNSKKTEDVEVVVVTPNSRRIATSPDNLPKDTSRRSLRKKIIVKKKG
ncbi:hypothetical protein D7X33_52995 [Butyricicoccus sp. 1XD8-22]|nr:hypothetical protein D7X33_52995 [Butyricicoccus sp. 1XD8-22]